MRIEPLKLRLTDQDLGDLIGRYFPDGLAIKDLTARFADEGIILAGRYRVKRLSVPFEATLRLQADGHVLKVHLAKLKAVGPVGNMLKGKLMEMVAKRIPALPGIVVDGLSIACDLKMLLAGQGFPAEFESFRIDTREGRLLLEVAGTVTVRD